MIGIKVNGEFLDLIPGTQIGLKLRNPIFAEGNIIRGSYSIPFKIPCEDASPKNDRILNQPREVSRQIRKRIYKDALLYFDNNQIKKGNLVVQNIQGGMASGKFQFGLSTVSEELKTVLVKDIIAEEIVLNATSYIKKVQIRANSTDPLKLTVNGKDYEALSPSTLADAINANEEPPLAKATYYDTGWEGGDGSYIEIEPLDNPTDLETPFEVSQPNGNDPRDTNLTAKTNVESYMQAIADVINPYLSDTPPDDKIRFPVVFNEAVSLLNERRTEKFREVLLNNQTDDTDPILKINTYPYTTVDSTNYTFYAGNYTSLAPFLKLKHVIESIISYFNISIEGDFLKTEDYKKALIYPATSLDSKQIYVGSKEFIFWKPKFNLSELVPQELKAIDLLKALQKRYSLAIYYDDDRRMLVINTREQILKDKAYTDLSGKISPIRSLEEIFLEGVKLKAEIEEEDKFATLDEHSTGTKDELVITTPISGIQSVKDFPEVPQVNIAPPIDSLRFVFEKGIVTETKTIAGRSSFTVVYYSATNNLDGHTNNFEGLYPAFWRQYIRFLMRRRRVKVEASLTLNDIININWERKYRIGEVNCLINEVDITLSTKGIHLAKLEMFTAD